MTPISPRNADFQSLWRAEGFENLTFTKPLNELSRHDLPLAGGKGANLGALIQAGLPVPPGFVVTTDGYRAFVAANALQETIQQALAATHFDDPLSLEAASAQIRARFTASCMPPAIADEISAAYQTLNQQSAINNQQFVAVRSSATAEDLPDLSFAGQQDTYLNILGEEALLDAVVRCWASLWTARAIGYRARNEIGQDQVALAVVVQQMVQSEASGVLFTANPLTGKRSETVMDATLGLGEALVSGQVEPDHYVVAGGQIISKTLGAKALIIQGKDDGGTVTIQQDAASRQALPDAQILALAQLGQRAAAAFGEPQDMEWAFVTDESVRKLSRPSPLAPLPSGKGGEPGKLNILGNFVAQNIQFSGLSPSLVGGGPGWGDLSGDHFDPLAGSGLYVVQSRPITSLYPLPEGMPAEPLQVMVSFGAVQGLLDPITPFGRDGIALLAASVSNLLGYPNTLESQRAFVTAGERIFTNATPLLRNRIGRNLVPRVLGAVEPGSQGFIKVLLNDPQFTPGHAPLRPQTAFKLLRRLVPMVFRMLRTLLAPERARTNIFKGVEEFCQWVETSGKEADTLAKRLDWLELIFQRLPLFMLERMIPTFAPGIAMWVALDQMAAELPQGERQVMEVTRGLPFNVTTEMDLALWETARAIQSDAVALAAVQLGEATTLAADFQAGRLPAVAQAAVQRFLARYGMRGVAEIDIGRTRWGENPTPIFQALKSYIQITDINLAPDAIFRRSAQSAESAIAALAEAARQLPHGRLKAWRIHWAAARVRALSGLRELPKFFAIRVMGLVRAQLLQSGADLVAAGALERPEQIFFLRFGELRQLAKTSLPGPLPQGDGNSPPPRGEGLGVRSLVAERLQANQREQRRRQVPRLLLSDGRAIFEGVSDPGGAQAANVLVGSPVSPGVVEGVVHIVLDPHREQLALGEILVCPGTDPAWTPLFLAAGGLVMEVGGLMTHGSVVAREYGIPAVVGVSQATTRLKNGQKIRVDGNSGKVVLL